MRKLSQKTKSKTGNNIKMKHGDTGCVGEFAVGGGIYLQALISYKLLSAKTTGIFSNRYIVTKWLTPTMNWLLIISKG
jgi:hypothetical protein